MPEIVLAMYQSAAKGRTVRLPVKDDEGTRSGRGRGDRFVRISDQHSYLQMFTGSIPVLGLLLLLLITSGCASMIVRSLGRTTIYDGPRGAVVWTNGDIGIKDVRFEVTEPRHSRLKVLLCEAGRYSLHDK